MIAPLRGSSATTAPSWPASAETRDALRVRVERRDDLVALGLLALELVEHALQVGARLAVQPRAAEALDARCCRDRVRGSSSRRRARTLRPSGRCAGRRLRGRARCARARSRRRRRSAPSRSAGCSSSVRALSVLSRSEEASKIVQREVNATSSANRTATSPNRRRIGRFTARGLIRAGPVSRLRISDAASPSERSEWSSSVRRRCAGDRGRADARDVAGLVERDVAGQPVGHALEQRHQPAGVGADEVDRLQREVARGADEHDHDAEHREHADHAPAPAPARSGALVGARPARQPLRDRRRGARRGARCRRPAAAGCAPSARRAASAHRGHVGERRLLGDERALRRLHLLEAQQHDRDVVAAARGVGGGDERLAGIAQARVLAQQLGDLLLGEHRREAVAAEQVDVARARVDGARVDLDRALRPERARDHRALRVLDRLLGREPALAHAARPRASGRRSGAAARHRAGSRRGCRRRARSRPRRAPT